MSIAVVTTCSANGYRQYGQKFFETFDKFWPKDVRLIFYCEEVYAVERHPRAEVRYLLDDCPWQFQFKTKHRNNPRANGTTNYLTDAVKFSHKVAAVCGANKFVDTDYLLWLDADIRTHEPVSHYDISRWLPEEAWVTWLERDPRLISYPECGFLLFNRHYQHNAAAFKQMEDYYVSESCLQLKESHDSFLWQHCVQTCNLKARNISGPGYDHVHAMVHSPLGAWFDHLKGDHRKKVGRTLKAELEIERKEAYWR